MQKNIFPLSTSLFFDFDFRLSTCCLATKLGAPWSSPVATGICSCHFSDLGKARQDGRVPELRRPGRQRRPCRCKAQLCVEASIRCDVTFDFTSFVAFVRAASGKWPYDAWATEAKVDGSRLQSVGSHGRHSKSCDCPLQLHSVHWARFQAHGVQSVWIQRQYVQHSAIKPTFLSFHIVLLMSFSRKHGIDPHGPTATS